MADGLIARLMVAQVSGMHAAVDAQILNDIGFTEEGRTEYHRRLRDEPGSIGARLRAARVLQHHSSTHTHTGSLLSHLASARFLPTANLYFAYMLTLCAIYDCRERLNNCGYLGDGEAVLPSMREQGSGCIINVTSVAGRIAAIGQSPYVASKWALEGVSEGMAQELAPHGIRVAIVEPGVVRTAIMAKNIDAPHETGAYDVAYGKLFRFYQAGLTNPGLPSEVADVFHEAATTDTPWTRLGAFRLRGLD